MRLATLSFYFLLLLLTTFISIAQLSYYREVNKITEKTAIGINPLVNMKKPAINKKVKLTANEKKVLMKIIEEGRVADTDMAKTMNISQQGVFRIRRKLEDSGVIEGYYPNINFKKIGINIIQVLGVKLNPIVWKTKKEFEIASLLKRIPYVFHAYRVTGHDITYMLTLGFKDIHQKDRFMKKLETLFIDQMEIKWSYNFSVENIITLDPLSLLYESITEKEYSFDKLF